MIELQRDEIKEDKVFNELLQFIISKHKPAYHTRKVLIQNKYVKDFCECSKHFVMITGEKPLFIHYKVFSWFKHPNGIKRKIESIGVYDDFIEYESSRLKALHSSNKSDIPNIN